MREIKPTQNPVPSSDPKDLCFNATKIDEVVNSGELTYVDRLGNKRMTVAGLESASGDASLAIEAANSALDSANKANASLKEVKEESANIESNAAIIASSAAKQVIDGVDGAVADANMYARQAESARDAAITAGHIFTEPEGGQSSSSVATYAYYWVVSKSQNDVLELWRKGVSSPTNTGKKTPSANVTNGLNLSQSAVFYVDAAISDVPPPVVEQSNDVTDFTLYLRFNRDIRIRTYKEVIVATWEKIKLDINNADMFGVSKNGIVDCLKIKDSSLVYDRVISKFSVVPFTDTDSTRHYIVATVAYGQLVGGLFFDWWVKLESARGIGLSETRFYLNNGHMPSSAPIVEPSTGDSFYLYIKLNEDIRIQTEKKLILASWQKIKEDVNDLTLYATSYSGIDDCLRLLDQALVYNQITSKFMVVPRRNALFSYYINIAHCVYGQLTAGLLLDWWLVKKRESSSISVAASASNTPKKELIAHGGMNGFNVLAPFNTLPAYRLAGEYGYYAAETDLVLTKDREWVLCHDEVLDHYTNGTGNVIDYTLAELKLLDASKKSWSYGWKNVPLATLDEYLQVCVTYNMRPFLEIKATSVTDADIDKIVTTVKKYMSLSEAVVITFSVSLLRRFRDKYKDLPLAYLTFAVNEGQIQEALALGNCILNVQSTSTQSMVDKARNAGLEVAMWTLNQSEIDSTKTQGVKYVATDAGIPYNFKSGTVASIFRNNADYSNLTQLGEATVIDGSLNIKDTTAYLDVTAKQGSAITVAVDARLTNGNQSDAIIEIVELDKDWQLLFKNSVIVIGNTSYNPSFTAAVALHPSCSYFRVSIQSKNGAQIDVRDIKIKEICV